MVIFGRFAPPLCTLLTLSQVTAPVVHHVPRVTHQVPCAPLSVHTVCLKARTNSKESRRHPLGRTSFKYASFCACSCVYTFSNYQLVMSFAHKFTVTY